MSESGEKKGTKSSGEMRVFLSHSTKDKAEVQKLGVALADRGVASWEDVLELRLGDDQEAKSRPAILEADGFVLLLTSASIGSRRVRQEARWAMEAKQAREAYALLPIVRGLDQSTVELLLGDAARVSFVLKEGEDIVHAVPAIVQALGLAPQDATARVDPLPAPPMAELLIELEEPKIHEEAGTRRAAARARVRYVPAGEGRGVNGQAPSTRTYRRQGHRRGVRAHNLLELAGLTRGADVASLAKETIRGCGARGKGGGCGSVAMDLQGLRCRRRWRPLRKTRISKKSGSSDRGLMLRR